MHRNVLAWSLILFLLVNPKGLPVVFVEFAAIIMMLVGASENILFSIYALIHFVTLFISIWVGRRRQLTINKVYILYVALAIQVLAPVILTLDIDHQKKIFVFITALPFWVASIALLTTLTKTQRWIRRGM